MMWVFIPNRHLERFVMIIERYSRGTMIENAYETKTIAVKTTDLDRLLPPSSSEMEEKQLLITVEER